MLLLSHILNNAHNLLYILIYANKIYFICLSLSNILEHKLKSFYYKNADPFPNDVEDTNLNIVT